MKIFYQRLLDCLTVLKTRGLFATLRLICNQFSDRKFDRNYKVNTGKLEDPRCYINSHSILHATFYAPTRAIPFLELMNLLKPNKNGVFVDYGCGKGRALILAAEAGFGHIKGIEIVEAWAELSKKNLSVLNSPHLKIEIFPIDVLDFLPAISDTFFYFYDPFDDEIIIKCIKKILNSYQNAPRQIHIVIHNNLKSNWELILNELKGLKGTNIEIRSERFYVFETKEEFLPPS